MSCPHSTRSDAAPTSCTLCLGVVVERRVLVTVPDGIDLELDFEATLTTDERRHREVSRNGGHAAARRRAAEQSPEQLSERQSAAARARWDRWRDERGIAPPEKRPRKATSPEELSRIRAAAAQARWHSDMTPEQRASRVVALRAQGRSRCEIASEVGCSLSTVARLLKGAA